MPDQAPTPTADQITAYNTLRAELREAGFIHLLDAIEPLLPDALTIAIPTAAGTTIYGGRDQPRVMFRLFHGERHWVDEHDARYTDAEAHDLMGEWETAPPASRVTREQIPEFVGFAHRAGVPGSVAFNDALFAAITNGVDQ